MDDTQKAEIEDEGQQPVELPPTEETAEVSAPPEDEARSADPEGELPEDAKERTRQEFEKLKAKNRELSEKLSQFEGPKPQRRSALDTFAPQQLVRKQEQKDQSAFEFQPIVPDENGYIDVNVLNQTNQVMLNRLKHLEEQAELARQKAEEAENKVATYEHTSKTSKVYQAHPYLDPTNDSFDEKFSDLVRKELLDQMVNQGREDYLEAANKVKAEYYDPSQKPTPQAAPEPVREQTDTKQANAQKRTQINAMQPKSSQGTPTDHDSLVQRSRLGDKAAIYERLKRSGY